MEKLTGKCLGDFNHFLYTNYPNNLISENCGYGYGMFERDLEQLTFVLPQNMNNALIIEFFDSVGIHVKLYPHLGGGQVVFYPTIMFLDEQHNTNEKDVLFDNGEFYYHESRTEAINNAIIKANEIYNEQ